MNNSTITLNYSDKGLYPMQQQTYNVEMAAPITINKPERKGYKLVLFEYPNLIGDTITNLNPPVDFGNKKFDGAWLKVDYKITYDLDGGINNRCNPPDFNVDKTVIFCNPTKEGFTFAGWVLKDSDTPITSIQPNTITEDITLKAKWTPNK